VGSIELARNQNMLRRAKVVTVIERNAMELIEPKSGFVKIMYRI
jgi:hypothetical protein